MFRQLRFQAGVVLSLAVVLATWPGCMPGPQAPATMPDLSTTRLSEKGLFRASFTPAIDPITVNQIHNWMIHIETAAGEPVKTAAIEIDGGMPDHGHGLPTKPQVTGTLGNGDYQVEGLKFSMRGWWVVNLHIQAGEQADTVTFNLWFP